MLFVIYCRDNPGSGDLRLATRDAHLAYVDSTEIDIRIAGPMLDDAGNMVGSMFVVDAAERAAVDAFSAADPYREAGLFERVDIHAFRQVFPR